MTRKFSLLLIVLTLAALIAPAASAGLSISVITNTGFESKTAATPALGPWKVVNGSSDKIVCGTKAKKLAGDCAFMFKGGAGEAAVLRQTVANPADLSSITAVQSNAVYFMLRYLSPNAATKLRTTLIVHYLPLGSTTPVEFKKVDKYSNTAPGEWGYAGSTYSPTIPQWAKVLKIEIRIKNMSTAGKTYIDNVELSLSKPIA